MTTAKHVYGWRPDKPDQRDRHYSFTRPAAGLPSECLYLPLKMPPVYDQGDLGSCTGNGIGSILHYLGLRRGFADPMPSRLFIYLEERRRERTITSDAGAEIRDGIKVVASLGAPPEGLWPYDISKFAVTPPPPVYLAAKGRHAIRYSRVPQSISGIKASIALDAAPVVFGFSVYESFEDNLVASTGQMTVPGPSESVLGGHCAVVVGYDDRHFNGVGINPGAALVRNSWGLSWGIHDASHPEFSGHFWMPYEVLLNSAIADDFWNIQEQTGTPLVK